MGNKISLAKEPEKRAHEKFSEREEIMQRLPDLPEQLEASFLTHDFDGEGVIPYEVLEPVLRHHLMQFGFIEYISRFTREDGSLNPTYVDKYLRHWGLNLLRPLNVNQWKDLACCWIDFVMDTQLQDVQQWQYDLKKMQEDQAYEFKMSLEAFRLSYLRNLEDYYQQVENEETAAAKLREEWAASEQLQAQFREDQEKSAIEKTEQADQLRRLAHEKEERIRKETWIALGRQIETDDGTKKFSFVYSADVHPTGVPVSGGCPMPRRQPKKKAWKTGMPPSIAMYEESRAQRADWEMDRIQRSAERKAERAQMLAAIQG